MTFLPNLTAQLLFIFALILLQNLICLAQNKVDLELKTETSSKVVNGGEKFTVTLTVTNLSQQTAENVTFGLDSDSIFSISPIVLNQEKCELYNERLFCRVKSLKGGESTVAKIEIQVRDFGDISELSEDFRKILSTASESTKIIASDLQRKLGVGDHSIEISARTFSGCETFDTNLENNDGRFTLRGFPSKNIPPRIEIVSPKNTTTIIKPLGKAVEVPITIKAFDVDGKLERVNVNEQNYQSEQNYQIVFEGNQMKIVFESKLVFDGKQITEQKVETNKESLAKSFGGDISKTGKDTYRYIWKNLKYGRNRIIFDVIDNGGRSALKLLEVEVKSDAEIKIISPKDQQVFPPNSIITVETTSKVNEGTTPKIILNGTKSLNALDRFLPFTPPVLEQISKAGNIYKHRLILKNLEEGVYNFETILFENGEDTKNGDFCRIIIAEPRIISIKSLKNGQELEQNKPIEIFFDVKDTKGQAVQDEIELLVDGKNRQTVSNQPIHWTSYEKGTHTLQIIAKHKFGIKLGESEIITVFVK